MNHTDTATRPKCDTRGKRLVLVLLGLVVWVGWTIGESDTEPPIPSAGIETVELSRLHQETELSNPLAIPGPGDGAQMLTGAQEDCQ